MGSFFSSRARVRAVAATLAGGLVTLAALVDAPGTATDALDGAVVEAASLAPAAVAVPADTPQLEVSGWAVGSSKLADLALDREGRRVRIEAASRSDARPSLVWPSPARLSGWWGERRGGRAHAGLDLDGETGDPISSAGEGVVVWAGQAPDGYAGYGLMVLVRHGGGVETLYAHLSRIRVRVGDIVETGDDIGAMGTTGNVTGSHLHFEVRIGGRQVNPRDWLPGR